MKPYELNYLISLDLKEEEAQSLQAKIVSLIAEEQGLVLEERAPFLKKLAYPIKKQTQAFLAGLNFQIEPEKLNKFEKQLKAENKILRYLLTIKRAVRKSKPIRSLKTRPEKTVKKEKKTELEEIDKKLDEMLES